MTPRRTRRPAFLDETLELRARRVLSRVFLIYSHIESAEWFAEQPHGQTGGEPRLLTVNGRFLSRKRSAALEMPSVSIGPLSLLFTHNVNFTRGLKYTRVHVPARIEQRALHNIRATVVDEIISATS